SRASPRARGRTRPRRRRPRRPRTRRSPRPTTSLGRPRQPRSTRWTPSRRAPSTRRRSSRRSRPPSRRSRPRPSRRPTTTRSPARRGRSRARSGAWSRRARMGRPRTSRPPRTPRRTSPRRSPSRSRRWPRSSRARPCRSRRRARCPSRRRPSRSTSRPASTRPTRRWRTRRSPSRSSRSQVSPSSSRRWPTSRPRPRMPTARPPSTARRRPRALRQGRGEAAAETSEGVAGMQSAKGAALAKLVADKGRTKTKDEAKRAEVTAKIQGIFAATEADVKKLLDGLDPKVEAAFDQGEAAARSAVESYGAAKMSADKKDRYSGWLGGLRWAKDKLLGMPDKVNEFYEAGRELYLKQMDGVITGVANIVGDDLTAAKRRIAAGRAEIAAYVKSLPADLKKVGAEAANEIGD